MLVHLLVEAAVDADHVLAEEIFEVLFEVVEGDRFGANAPDMVAQIRLLALTQHIKATPDQRLGKLLGGELAARVFVDVLKDLPKLPFVQDDEIPPEQSTRLDLDNEML